MVLLALLIIVIQIITSTVLSRLDADDSFYLSLMNQNIGSRSLYLYDPSTGNINFPMLPFYILEAWELILSAISFVTQIPIAIVAHTLIPILIIILSYMAYARLFETIIDRQYVPIMLIFLSIFHIMGGYTNWSNGAFLLGRAWQGKAILLNIIIPLLQHRLLVYFREPQKKHIIHVAIINIAAFCLNPTAIFLCVFLVVSFIVIALTLRSNTFKDIIKLSFSVIPLFIFSAILYHISSNFLKEWPITIEKQFSFMRDVVKFSGGSIYKIFFIFALPFLGFFFKGNSRILLFWYPLTLFLTLINPIVAPFWARNITSVATYWRVLWLIPIGTSISYIGALLAQFGTVAITEHKRKARSLYALIVVFIYSLLIMWGGKFLYSEENRFTKYKTAYKIPDAIVDIGLYLKDKEKAKMLAPREAAEYIRGIASNVELLFSRELYMKGFLSPGSAEYKERLTLFQIANGNITNYEHLSTWLKKYKVRWILCEKKNEGLINYLHTIGTILDRSNDQYVLMELFTH